MQRSWMVSNSFFFFFLVPNINSSESPGWLHPIRSAVCAWAGDSDRLWDGASFLVGWHTSTWKVTFYAFSSSYLCTIPFHSILPLSGSCCSQLAARIPCTMVLLPVGSCSEQGRASCEAHPLHSLC